MSPFFSIFFLVKNSVDWATASKQELIKLSDKKAKSVTDRINDRFNYIRRTE